MKTCLRRKWFWSIRPVSCAMCLPTCLLVCYACAAAADAPAWSPGCPHTLVDLGQGNALSLVSASFVVSKDQEPPLAPEFGGAETYRGRKRQLQKGSLNDDLLITAISRVCTLMILWRSHSYSWGKNMLIHWIGLRENLQETMVFTIKYRAFL